MLAVPAQSRYPGFQTGGLLPGHEVHNLSTGQPRYPPAPEQALGTGPGPLVAVCHSSLTQSI